MTYLEERTEAPAWFLDALATTAEIGAVEVVGARIAYRAWGPAGHDGIILVHGGAAHSRWWDHIAPLLAADVRVVALDLSGHGDSSHRDRYGLDLWAEEVMAAAAPAASKGRRSSSATAWAASSPCAPEHVMGARLRAVAAVDSPLRDFTAEERAAREGQAFVSQRVYPTAEDAIARFRTLPPQDTLPFVLKHVAETSVREVEGGWSWKFDPGVFHQDPVFEPVLPVDCPAILMAGEYGLLAGHTPNPLTDAAGWSRRSRSRRLRTTSCSIRPAR